MTEFKVTNNAKITFTKSQEVAIDELIKFVDAPWNDKDFVRALSGPGGTGKTFSTKYIIENCRWTRSLIKCCTPTHKACRVLSKALDGMEVNTIQSMFGFRLDVDIENFDPEQPRFAPKGKPKLVRNGVVCKLLIVDEASMLNYKLVNYILKTCKSNSIKVLFIGDASQLPPVNEKISTAFTVASKVFYLKEIVRQEDNNPVKHILEILRKDIDNNTFNFFTYITKHREEINDNDKGFLVCDNMEFDYMVEQCFTDEEFTKNVNKYRIVAYTNAKVAYWNNLIRQNIIKDADKGILTQNDLVMSYTNIVDEFGSMIFNNSDDYIINNIGNYYDPEYKFKCFLVQFVNVANGRKTPNICVIDHTDRTTFIAYYNKLTELVKTATNADASSRVGAWKNYYDFKRRYLLATNIVDRVNPNKIIFSRDMDYGFAITANKAQGSTYNTVLIDVNDIVFNKYGAIYANKDELLRRLYVACSRPSNKLIMLYGK